MSLVARRFAWLLPLVLCACAHNPDQSQMQALAPPLEDTPPPPPDLAPTALPAPVISVPKTKEPVAIAPEPVKAVPKHHKPSKAGAAQAGTAAGAPANQVAEAAPAEVSASGDFKPPEAPDSKKLAENSIADIERGLNGIGRRLNDQETKTSVQIRELLKQAREALATDDLEGAKTFTTKAKALLGELGQ